MQRTLASSLASAAAAALLLVSFAGCGGDDDSGSTDTTSSGPADVSVHAADVKFDSDSYSASAGSVAFELVNEDSLPHTLLIEDVDGFKLSTDGNDEDSGSTDLEPGTYTIFCDIPGHRSAGMEATLEVT
jgi:plastocyanin